jgi:acyl carrier protein
MDQGNQLEESVIGLVVQAAPGKIDRGSIKPTSSLRRDLGLDSLGLATLLFRFGELLGVDPDELLEMLADEPVQTVADLVALGARVTSGTREGSRE